MSHAELYRRWRRRLASLQKKIAGLLDECRSTGGAECVHDLRVAVRRARLYAHIGRPLLRKGTIRRFNAWSRRINKLLGPVRDRDVCLNWLVGCPNPLDAVQLVHAERVRLWRKAEKGLRPRKYSVPAVLSFRKADKSSLRKLAAHFESQWVKASTAVLESAPQTGRMNASELHTLRRRLRRWRYLRELGLVARVQRKDPTLARLIKVQNTLGEVQNLEMIIELMARLLSTEERERLIARARSQQARWVTRARRGLMRSPRVLD